MRLEKLHRILAYSALMLSLFSCAFYRPSSVKNPLLREQGDLHLGGSVGSTFDANIAYSPINHFYVHAAAGTAPGVSESSSDTLLPPFEEEYSNHYYEASLGFYDTLFLDIRMQGAFGFGAGEAGGYRNNLDSGLTMLFPFAYTTYGIYGADYQNYFGQLSLQQEIDHHLNLSLTYRLNYLKIDQMDFYDGDGREADFNLDSRSHMVSQLALELNKEERDIGGFLQLQLAFAEPYSDVISVRRIGVHFGIYLKLNELFAKRNRKKSSRIKQPAEIDDDQEYRSNW